jgi:hypothetical protein
MTSKTNNPSIFLKLEGKVEAERALFANLAIVVFRDLHFFLLSSRASVNSTYLFKGFEAR